MRISSLNQPEGPEGDVSKFSRKNVLCAISLLCLTLYAIGCAPSLNTKMLCPAQDYEASKLKRVAVLPFNGPGGRDLSSRVEALLVGVKIGEKPYFTVVERSKVNKVLEEQKLGMTGLLNGATASRIGNLVGADGIMMGVVNKRDVRDKSFTEERRRCAAQDKKGNCVSWQKYTVGCTERDAYFSFTPKVVNVDTGEVVASDTLTGSAKASACSDSGYGLEDSDQLLTQAENQALAKLRPLIAPYYVLVKIDLITKDDSKMPKEVKEEIAEGVKWAKANRLDRARDCWEKAYEMHNEGYATPYLVGFCAEMTGNYNKALDYYKEADMNTTSPNKTINAALTRVRSKIEAAKKLKETM